MMPIRVNPPTGLSPRGRGKPTQKHLRQAFRRSIPAWAGETKSSLPHPYLKGVYPRVGGGNALEIKRAQELGGLSPRGRGKPQGHRDAAHPHRSIPAWAGETI